MTREELQKEIKSLYEKVNKEGPDLHVFLLITSVKDSIGDPHLFIAGDVRIIAQTLGDAIEQTPDLREQMVLYALHNMMRMEECKNINKNKLI